MIDFGYGLTPSSAIDLDKMDRTRFEILIRREPDVLMCMACGSCAASCSAGVYTTMNLRKGILLLSRGQEKSALEQFRSCMLCGKCQLVCPRGINTRNLILSILKTYSIQ